MLGVLAALFLCPPLAAQAQDGSVTIELEREEDVGLEGFVRPGTWAPLRLTIRNNRPSLRTVAVDWLVPDVDGDIVVARRHPVVLSGNGQMAVQLYAMPAFNVELKEGWRVRVIDSETEELLAVTRVAPPANRQPDRRMKPWTRAIGLAGGAGFSGLDRFRDMTFQQEERVIIEMPDLALLPDRWYGMQLLDALVWTKGARSLTNSGVRLDVIKDWVRRGGHLVISLTAADANWTDERLADLLPPVIIGESKKVAVPHWFFLYRNLTQFTNVEVSVRELTAKPGATRRELAMLQPMNPDLSPTEPPLNLIAAHQYGFGRVTLIGVDVADPILRRYSDFQDYGLPRLWQCVFGWRTPAYLDEKEIDKAQKLKKEASWKNEYLTDFVAPRIAMKTKAAATLGLAIFFFAIYWFVAGPISYVALRSRGKLQHSWMVFGIVVVGFSVLSWGGAMMLKPGRVEIEHFSVIDVDATGTEGAYVRAHSWCSLFIPEHTSADLRLGQVKRDEAGDVREVMNLNTIASPGLPDVPSSDFADERRYVMNALSPGVIKDIPFRSTAKQFEMSYYGLVGVDAESKPWWPPEGKVVASGTNLPRGSLTHHLPGTLKNVTFVYCEGNGKTPRVWADFSRDWEPNTPYSIALNNPQSTLLVQGRIEHPKNRRDSKGNLVTGYENRVPTTEGWLGSIIGRRGGQSPQIDDDGNVKKVVPNSGTIVDYLILMSFLDAAPPPNFIYDPQDFSGASTYAVHFLRSTGHGLDITELTAARRLIVIGHLQDGSPLPMPLAVNGDRPRSNGWTMVRFILPVGEE